MDTQQLYILLSVALLLLLSGFFSGSETAVLSYNRYKLLHKVKTGSSGAKKLLHLIERPEQLFSVILIGNNLVNVAATSLATYLAFKMAGDVGVFWSTIAMTILLLIFSEQTPKTLSARFPEAIALPASHILWGLKILLKPLAFCLNTITKIITTPFIKLAKPQNTMALEADEIRVLVNQASELIPKEQRDMLLGIMDLHEIKVHNIMIPLNQIEHIDISQPVSAWKKIIGSTRYSYLPVWDKSPDKMLGILKVSDLMKTMFKKGEINKTDISAKSRAALYVPENGSLHLQIQMLMRNELGIALVADEYGDVQGILSLHDIMEEIVGYLEREQIEQEIEKVTENSYRVDGEMRVRDINLALKISLPTIDASTIQGLVVEHLQDFPQYPFSFTIDDVKITIQEIKDNTVKWAYIQLDKKVQD